MSEINPLVSVVIPVYNVEKYLDRCVKSVVDQTYSNIEIILVDDGSTDKSSKICDDWAEKDCRIKVIHKENQGAGCARNSALDISTGEYVTFVDADDYIDSDLVFECIQQFKKNNSEVVCVGRKLHHEDGEIYLKKVNSNKTLYVDREITEVVLANMLSYKIGFGVSVWAKMFKSKIIKENKLKFYSEREVYSEDTLFVMEIFSNISKVSILDKNLYYHFVNKGSLSSVYNADRERTIAVFIEKALNIADENNFSNNLQAHLFVRYHCYMMAVLKRIMASDEVKVTKKNELRNIYTNKLFRRTLKLRALRKEKAVQGVYLLCIKFKLFALANAMLMYKVKK